MKKRWQMVLLIGLTLALLTGCAAPAPRVQTPRAEVPAIATAQPAAREIAGQSRSSVADKATTASGADTERMIVRTVNLSLVVTSTETALEAISGLATATGGYVSDSKTWRQNEQLRGTVKLRIPADRLDSTLAAIKKLAVRVEAESLGGQDVTEEYSDLNAQLVNLEATEKELRELLSEVRQRTQKAEDILQVYRELTTIRGEIERVKGRMQYLSNLTALATITVELIPDALARPVVEPGWRPLETLRNASRALVNALKGLVDVLIYLVILVLPIVLVIGAVIYGLVWLLRRLTRARKPKSS